MAKEINKKRASEAREKLIEHFGKEMDVCNIFGNEAILKFREERWAENGGGSCYTKRIGDILRKGDYEDYFDESVGEEAFDVIWDYPEIKSVLTIFRWDTEY